MRAPPFAPKRGFGLEQSVRHIEEYLARFATTRDRPGPGGDGLPGDFLDPGGGAGGGGGGDDPPEGRIPEDLIDWDPVAGHYHDGAISRAIALHGDVTGFNTAAVVEQIQTRPVPLPAAPEDGMYPKYDDATQALVWSVPVSTGTQFQADGWYDPDISTRGTSVSELYQGDSQQVQLGEGMLADGSVVGIGCFLSGDVGAAGVGYYVELYIDGIATGHTVQINGAAGAETVGINISFEETFLRTQVLTIYAKRIGAPSAVKARAFLLVQLSNGGGGSVSPGNAPSDALFITAAPNAVLTSEILTSAVIGKGSLATRNATSPYGGFLWMVDDSASDTPRWSRYNGSGWDDWDPASYGASHLCVLRAGDTMSGKLALSITASGASGDQEVASFQHGDPLAHPYVTIGTTAGDAGVFLLYNKTSAQGRIGKHGSTSYAFEWGASGAVVHNAGVTVAPGAPFHLRFSEAGGSSPTTQRLSTHLASTNPSSGWGSVEKWQLSTDDGAGGVGTTRDAADLTVLWATALDGSRKARATWGVYDTAVREGLRLEASGAAAMIGFLGAPAIVRPTSTTDLRAALINLGLYTTGGASPLDLNGGAFLAGTGGFTGPVTITPGTTATKGLIVNAPASFATNWLEFNDSGGNVVCNLNQNTQFTLNPPKTGTGTGFTALKYFAYGSTAMVMDCFFAAGDRTTPTAVASNSSIAAWRCFAHNGTTQPIGGQIAFKTAELQAVGSAGTDIVFSLCANTTASLVDVLKLANDGSLKFGSSFDTNLKRVSAGVLQTDGAFRAVLSDNLTGSTSETLRFGHNSSGTPGAGFGSTQKWQLASSSTADQDAAQMATTWVVATHASRTARVVWNVYDTAVRECLRMEASGTAAMIGFLGHAASARVAAYTLAGSATRTFPTDPSSAYTGIATGLGSSPYAAVADLNTLRGVVSSLEGVVRQIVADFTTYGLLQ